MAGKIGEQTTLTVDLLEGASAGNSTRVELRPTQDVLANADVVNGKSTFTLNTTGQFELHVVSGPSSCKLPELKAMCAEGFEPKGPRVC